MEEKPRQMWPEKDRGDPGLLLPTGVAGTAQGTNAMDESRVGDDTASHNTTETETVGKPPSVAHTTGTRATPAGVRATPVGIRATPRGQGYACRDLGARTPPHAPLIHVGRAEHEQTARQAPRPEAQLGKEVGDDHADPSLDDRRRASPCAGCGDRGVAQPGTAQQEGPAHAGSGSPRKRGAS